MATTAIAATAAGVGALLGSGNAALSVAGSAQALAGAPSLTSHMEILAKVATVDNSSHHAGGWL